MPPEPARIEDTRAWLHKALTVDLASDGSEVLGAPCNSMTPRSC
jgi:hypothetical protein